VWSCYYSGFPIVHIDSQQRVRAWETELSGTRALAVSGESVLVYGGYGENVSGVKLFSLSTTIRIPDGYSSFSPFFA
jgi:hypothetical protein